MRFVEKRFDGQEILDTRLEEFRCLKPGWLDGHGEAFSAEGLKWLGSLLTSLRLPRLPYLYPAEGEHVLAQWDAGAREITLEFDLKTKEVNYFIFDKDTDETKDCDFDLKNSGSIENLAVRIKESFLSQESSGAKARVP